MRRKIMNNDLFEELLKTNLFVLDGASKEIIGNAFVISFTVPEKGSMPLLIVAKSTIEKTNIGIVNFDLSLNGVKEKYPVGFSRKDAENFVLAGTNVCAFPIAHIYDVIAKEKKSFEFKSIQEDLTLSSKTEGKVSDIDKVGFFVHIRELEKDFYISRDSISPINNCEEFYIEKCDGLKPGTPVFINSSGTFVQNNSINLGSRLFLVGVAGETTNSFTKIFNIKKIVEAIKNKYKIS